MLVLISGLPRSGKSTFADALESSVDGFTHVPLDKYIKEIPEGVSFLDWVDTPACIDWELLNAHIKFLKHGKACFTPQPDWNARGRRTSDGGLESGGRYMRPAKIACVIPGCHAFRFPTLDARIVRVFMETPYEIIVARLAGNASQGGPANVTLDEHLSMNWRTIENYSKEADLIIRGTDDGKVQIRRLLDRLAVPEFTTAAAGDDDYDAVFALHEQLFRAHIEQIWGWHEDWQRQNFRSNWKSCNTCVIECGGKIIGYVQSLRNPGHILLKNIGLLPTHQGKGIGCSLVKSLQTEAAALHLPIRLSVFVTNPEAQQFYERMGFVNESRTGEFQNMIWSRPEQTA